MFPDHIELETKSNWRGNQRFKPPFYKRGWFGALIALAIVAGIGGFVIATITLAPLKAKAAAFDLNELRKLEAASVIFDRNGEELAKLYMLNRTPVQFKEVPQHLVDALVSQEDSRYFGHNGVDYQGIARAVWLNFQAGRDTQGASTITQQLARNAFQLTEKSYKRKLLEALTAMRIEENFSKSQILELYLNRIYFGGGFYGIQAAAKGYFGKDVKEITIPEAATLCGLIKSPNNIQPIRHPDRALKERNQVLDRMVTEGYLGSQKASELKRLPMITAPQNPNAHLSYIFDEVRKIIVDLVGEDRAAVGGFQIYTSIDKSLQKNAEEAVQKRLSQVEERSNYAHQTFTQYRALAADYAQKIKAGIIKPTEPKPVAEYLQGAALVIDNATGAMLAMVGGRDFLDGQYNRALYSRRPAGTAFLPFVYAAAFSTPDIFPGTLVEDAPIDNRRVMVGATTGILGEWGIEDSKTYSMSTISLRESLVQSWNAATVRLGDLMGNNLIKLLPDPQRQKAIPWTTSLASIQELARKSGIASPLKEYPSTFLGASEIELDELCLAYSTFPNGGVRPAKLHLVERITEGEDKVIFQVDLEQQARATAMDPIASFQTHSCLVDALERGTGKAARAEFGLGPFPVAGKTGTYDGFKDLWFMGYTSAITCGVWVGFDKQKAIYDGAFSSRIALPIWTDIVNATVETYPPAEIPVPPGVERVELCKKTGMKATDFCFDRVARDDGREQSVRSTYFEYTRPGTRFDLYCTAHTGEGVTMDILAFSRVGLGGRRQDSGGSAGLFTNVEPVHLQGLTILGQDPYNSIQPLPRAVLVDENGSEIKRAEPVESLEDGPQELPIRLSPPPRIFIEDDHPGLTPAVGTR
jgi:membrane carboxypeptidase/penicillin-binding protein